MPSLKHILQERSNDYSTLETHYRAATGAELVAEPFESFGCGPAITRSATVLIGAHNSAGTLEKTLISIDASTFNAKYGEQLQVVVVDDGSTDENRDVVNRTPLNLNLLYVRQAHAGLTRAHNTGLAFATGDIIIFSDSDMVHTLNSIEEMMKRHEVLDNIVAVGFRFEIAGDDPSIRSDRLRESLRHFEPAFHLDFRLNFPGRPNNMCRDTRHLKNLGHARSIQMPNGARYNLPAMTVGAFMSFRRRDYLAMGGSDERLTGWGCEDSLIGARSIALGNFVIPVYPAASAHVSHSSRMPDQAAQFAANLATAARILDEPFAPAVPPLDAWRSRALEVIEHRHRSSASSCSGDNSIHARSLETADAPAAAGACHYAIGQYQQARMCYTRAATLAPDVTWHHLGRAKSARELGEFDEGLDAFATSLALAPWNCWATFELGLTHARLGDYTRARELVERARDLTPDVFEFRWVLGTPPALHKARGNYHASQDLHAIAVSDFDLALIGDAGNPWAHHDRGASLSALNRREEALASHQRADQQLHPEDGNRSWVHAALGRLHADLGHRSQAKVQLEKALALWPAHPSAADDLRGLHVAGAGEFQLHCHVAVVEMTHAIEGWLTDEEAELLVAATRNAAALVPESARAAVVEIGSYCGKSTVAIGAALKELARADLKLYAVDPHRDYHFGWHADTFDILMNNLRHFELVDHIEVIRARSTDFDSPYPIVLLFIDGLHDYANVLSDFQHFEQRVVPQGLIAFHDYFEHCPGVKQSVNELLMADRCEFVTQSGSLVVCRKA